MAEHKPLYRHSFEEASRLGELEHWRASHAENVACRDYISQSIDLNYDGLRLGGQIAEHAIAKYGYDRVNWVLANTIQLKEWDGRFSSANKEWAQGFFISDDRSHREAFLIDQNHPGLVDLVVTQARRAYDQLNLFGAKHCTSVFEFQDVAGHVLALKPEALAEAYRTPESQVFLAQSGFGCKSAASGRKIFGEFLVDGEKAHFDREDFLGVLKPDHLPDWAVEKMAQPEAEPVHAPEALRIKVFQINRDRDIERRCFESLRHGQQIDASIYDVVYDGPAVSADPEAIFQQFNLNPPPLHRGWSMSVSDVVAMEGKHLFVDRAGFQEVDFDATQTQKPEGLLKVVVVEPGQPAYKGEIGPDLKSMQRALGGLIEVTCPFDDNVAVVSNEEAKLIGMEGNCHIGVHLFAGPLLIVGDDGEGGFCSLSDAQADEYCSDFAEPEIISQEEVQDDIRIEFHGF